MINNKIIKSKVLIVEDNSIVALDIENSLKKFGFDVVKITTEFDRVFKSINEDAPNIILMDINLGGSRDGIELVNEILKIKKIPVIYLTGFCDDDTMQRAFSTNPAGYIVKPFKKEELKSSINLALYKINKLKHKSINQNRIFIGSDYYFDDKSKKLYYQSRHIKLGLKEKKLLSVLVEAKGKFILSEELEQKLWMDAVPSHSSLRTLIYRLKMKLGYEIIESSYAQGYKLKVFNYQYTI